MVRNILFFELLIILSMSACSSIDDDLQMNHYSIYNLMSDYNAEEIVNSSDRIAKFDSLPIIEVSKALSILNEISCKSVYKDSLIMEKRENDTLYLLKLINKINDNCVFEISLKTSVSKDGYTYYNGYSDKCNSDEFLWEIDLFSIANSQDCYKNLNFKTESFIVMKINDNGIKYIKIPYSISGTYNKQEKSSIFNYMF